MNEFKSSLMDKFTRHTHSFGVDSSRVLEEIMESGQRTEAVQDCSYARSPKLLRRRNYVHAKELVAKLIEQVGENDPEVTRTRTLLEFMEDEK